MNPVDFRVIRSDSGRRYAYNVNSPAISYISGADSLDDREVEEIINQQSPQAKREYTSPERGWFRPDVVSRLTLVLLNKCNIKCDYCYEEGGTFGMTYSRMSRELAFKSIDEIYANYKSVDFLMFFGGEPLLMARDFPAICDYVIAKCEERGVPSPQFGVITNAVLVNDKIVDIFKKYNITVTVSIDGPADVHDHFRKTKAGTGSHTLSVAGYWKLKNAGINTFIQSTLSEENIGERSVESIVEYFNDELDCSSPHMTAAGIDGDGSVKPNVRDGLRRSAREYIEAVGDGRKPKGFSMVDSMLRGLIDPKESEFTCPAGFEIAVSPDGQLYPCFMFVGKDEFYLGSVQTGIDDEYWTRLEDFMARSDKRTRLGCSTCWARNLCSSCMGNNNNCAGSADLNPAFHCDIIRGCAKEVISALGDLQADEARWKRFTSNLAGNMGAPVC